MHSPSSYYRHFQQSASSTLKSVECGGALDHANWVFSKLVDRVTDEQIVAALDSHRMTFSAFRCTCAGDAGHHTTCLAKFDDSTIDQTEF